MARPRTQFRWNHKDMALRLDGEFYLMGDFVPTEKLDAKKKQSLIDGGWLVRDQAENPDEGAEAKNGSEV